MERIWSQIKDDIRGEVPQGHYDLWIKPIELGESSKERIVLRCPNEFHRNCAYQRFGENIKDAWGKYVKSKPPIFWDIGEKNGDLPQDKKASEVDYSPKMVQERVTRGQQLGINRLFNPLGIHSLNSRFTFDQFVVGDCNEFAFSASQAMAKQNDFYHNALYILADSGLGKSHLSQAVGNYLINGKTSIRPCYLTAEEFANEMIAALRSEKIEKFKEKYRQNCDLMILEKVEFLSGKMKMQTEFTYTLDFLLDSGKRFVCTSNYYPKDIPKLRNDLRSRLSGALIAPINPPDFETRVKIVEKKAANQDIKLPAKVIDFLSERITKDIRQLESCMAGLILKSSITKKPVDLSMAEEVLETMIDSRPGITIDKIKEVVARCFKIDQEDLASPSRRQVIAYPRNVSMYLCQQYTNESLVNIGKAFNRSHSTVLYSIKRLKKEFKKNTRIKKEVEFVRNNLETYCLRNN